MMIDPDLRPVFEGHPRLLNAVLDEVVLGRVVERGGSWAIVGRGGDFATALDAARQLAQETDGWNR